MEEEVLFGGLVNRVVRIGATVRRPAGPWTATVHELLAHLVDAGFPAPRPLGLDDSGREIVEFIPGRAALHPWPPELLGHEGVRAVASFVRDFHEAVAGFRPTAPALWRAGQRDLLPGEIVRHGDLGPYNIIWSSGRPVGLIDWDLAYPGPAIHDLAFLAWQIVPLRPDDVAAEAGFSSPPDRKGRLETLADGYGLRSTLDLLLAAEQVHVEDHRRMRQLGLAGLSPWAGFIDHGLPERAEQELRWLRANFDALAR